MTPPASPALGLSDPLLELHAELPSILATAGHASIWGLTLSPLSPINLTTSIVLQKYLRSNANDVEAAKVKLTETLQWRKEFGLDREGKMEGEDDERFSGLGFVTKVRRAGGPERVVSSREPTRWCLAVRRWLTAFALRRRSPGTCTELSRSRPRPLQTLRGTFYSRLSIKVRSPGTVIGRSAPWHFPANPMMESGEPSYPRV